MREHSARASPASSRWLTSRLLCCPLAERNGDFSALPAAFAELGRVVSPGGPVALLDITEPSNPALRRLFRNYFSRAAPALGAVTGNAEAYRYLVGSLAHLPPPDEMLGLLGDAGFDRASARPITGGIITLFTAVRG